MDKLIICYKCNISGGTLAKDEHGKYFHLYSCPPVKYQEKHKSLNNIVIARPKIILPGEENVYR